MEHIKTTILDLSPFNIKLKKLQEIDMANNIKSRKAIIEKLDDLIFIADNIEGKKFIPDTIEKRKVIADFKPETICKK